MKQFTNYCTGEQTLKAHELGAQLESGIARGGHWDGEERPFIYREPDPDCIVWNNSSCWYCPTTQQMIGWLLEEHSIHICVAHHPVDNGFIYTPCVYFKDNSPAVLNETKTKGKAELAAIDAALDYLEKEK